MTGTAAAPAPAVTDADLAAVAAQLGRPPRGVRAVAHRCSCGLPDVVETAPRLADGTPFPTLYYLTCPRACSAIGRLEAAGVMREMTDRLAADAELADAYRRAHEEYLRRRDGAEARDDGEVPAGAEAAAGHGISAGGMPDRVKCLHALVAYELAAYELAAPNSNPFGREALDRLAAGSPPVTPDTSWGGAGRCVPHRSAGPA